MYNSIHSHRGSAIIVALIIVVLLSILTVTFLEKVLNLAKSSGNINSSAQSYSFATSIIEEQLMNPAMTKTAPWGIPEKAESQAFTGRSLIAATGGTTMPVP
jgi:Tfp pilus assembly protein PilX